MSNQDLNRNQQKTNFDRGLNREEVEKRRLDFGYNEIPEQKTNFWANIGKRFWGIVPCMLEVTAVATFILGKYIQSGAIVALIFFNAECRFGVKEKLKDKKLFVKLRCFIRIFTWQKGFFD